MPPSTRRADYRRYRQLVDERPDLFTTGEGGIQILLDEAEIRAAQRRIARLNRAKGLPPASASVGVLIEDAYILAVRDAVRFPDGSLGTYNRVIYAQPGGAGVLAMAEDRIVLIRIWRHPIRRWLLEIPRGTREAGHSLEETARREVAEEIGGTVTRLVPLGRTMSDTSLCDGGLDLFFAELSEVGAPQLSEGISELLMVSPAEFEILAAKGDIQDPHALAAFSLAKAKGLV